MKNWAKVVEVGQKQFGLITKAQLEKLGLDEQARRWARDSARLSPYLPRVYRLAGTPESWALKAVGGLLAAGDSAALSHGTAAMLYRLPEFERTGRNLIELTVPADTRLTLPDHYRVHRTTRAFTPWRKNGVPRTFLGRTMLDLSGTLDEERFEIALDQAHVRWKALPRWLDQELNGLDPRIPGVGQLKQLLAVRQGPPAESRFETRMRRRLRARGIIAPTHQLDIYDDMGFIMRVDEAWPVQKIAAHGDSYLWHADRKTFDADAMKRTRLAALGWLSFEITEPMLAETAWIDQLERALKERTPQLELFNQGSS